MGHDLTYPEWQEEERRLGWARGEGHRSVANYDPRACFQASQERQKANPFKNWDDNVRFFHSRNDRKGIAAWLKMSASERKYDSALQEEYERCGNYHSPFQKLEEGSDDGGDG